MQRTVVALPVNCVRAPASNLEMVWNHSYTLVFTSDVFLGACVPLNRITGFGSCV